MITNIDPSPNLSLTDRARLASLIRARTVAQSSKTGTPHLGSCLSVTDILVSLYFGALRLRANDPNWTERDRCILSKGHAAPVLFQVLAERGFFPLEVLRSYGLDGGIFAEHPPTPDHLAGIEAATGSLGHGLPMGLGMAYAARFYPSSYKVFVVLGDGECNEGSVWEAAMLAAAKRVSNLCVLIDFNQWQATDRSKEVMALEPLDKKWESFGWSTSVIDGHDHGQLQDSLSKAGSTGMPTAIVCRTVKGKGVSFMEDDNNWHYRIPNADEVRLAYSELGVSL